MAYGARLESVLGESPQGFESPILRQSNESPDGPRSAGALVYPGGLPVSPIAPLPAGPAPA